MPFKVCIIGKCPPIQGGVSWNTYQTSIELINRGYEVHLISNADEVEYGYRQLFLPEDFQVVQADRRKGLNLHLLQKMKHNSFIPFSKAYTARLFGLANEVVDKIKPDLLFGWYLLPYGFVAAQLGYTRNIPYALMHAGSDLGRLSKHPDLKRSFSWMIENANIVFTTRNRKVLADLKEISVRTEHFWYLNGVRPIHNSYKNPKPLKLSKYRQIERQRYKNFPLPDKLMSSVSGLNKKDISKGKPTIGIYGKVGIVKGNFDLLAALDNLISRGIEFNFVSISAGRYQDLETYYRKILEYQYLARRTWILPPIAPWRIPSFIKMCDIVCFLERDFGITYHTPIIPREILQVGACLVCSEEVAKKRYFRGLLVDHENCVIISDPQNIKELSNQLEEIILNEGMRNSIAAHGKLAMEAFWQFVEENNMLSDPVSDGIEGINLL